MTNTPGHSIAFCHRCAAGLICPQCSAKDGREDRLIALLRQAQNRLRNQGDVPAVTHAINIHLHDDIESELGGTVFIGRESRGGEKA